MNLKSLIIFREHAQIFAGNLLAYLLLLLRVNKGDTSSFETSTAETSAIYSITFKNVSIYISRARSSAGSARCAVFAHKAFCV